MRVERGGEVVWEVERRGERVMDAAVAHRMTDVLRGVVTSGTGRAADIGRPAAGKTGTTSRHADACFVGYTPHLTAAVWLGRPEGNASMPGNPVGGGLPARARAQFVGVALSLLPTADFPEPPSARRTRPPRGAPARAPRADADGGADARADPGSGRPRR